MVHYYESKFLTDQESTFNFLMVVDFVKVVLYMEKETLLNSPLNFQGQYDVKTFEILEHKIEAEYYGLKFTIYKSGIILLKGSLHKYYNSGTHNHSDFSHSQLCEVLKDLNLKFGINLHNSCIQNIEFGVNVETPFKVEYLLNDLLIHGSKKFRDISVSGNMKQAEYLQYRIKLYDKGVQYRLGKQLMRFEIKVNKMTKIKCLGVSSLHDLMYSEWFPKVGQILLKEWNKVLVYENPINVQEIPKLIRTRKLDKWKAPMFWNQLSKVTRSKARKEFENYVRKFTGNRKMDLMEIIKVKISELKPVTF